MENHQQDADRDVGVFFFNKMGNTTENRIDRTKIEW